MELGHDREEAFGSTSWGANPAPNLRGVIGIAARLASDRSWTHSSRGYPYCRGPRWIEPTATSWRGGAVLDRSSAEAAPEFPAHRLERATGPTIGEAEVDWLVDHVDRTKRPLPDGVFDQLTRQARELLHLEWLVLEPERLDLERSRCRPAVSLNTVLANAADVDWHRELLDRLWQERYPARADRRRAIARAIRSEAQALRHELSGTDSRASAVIAAIVDRQTTKMLARVDDRADDPDVDRAIEHLTDKLRVTVRVAMVTETSDWPTTLAELTAEIANDHHLGHAWSACGHPTVDIPQLPIASASADAIVSAPESWGRDPLRHLALMLDPAGSVDSRPLPNPLRAALRSADETSEIARTVAVEVRRAMFPGGLVDDDLRARWFLAVLLAESRWTSRKLHGEVARHTEQEPVSALRRLTRAEPMPQTIDRVRGAALLQAGNATEQAFDADGWQSPVAEIAFEGAPSSRFAVSVEVALALAPVDACGTRLRSYFDDGPWNRASRFGEVDLDLLCELATARYRQKTYQRLLKDDQLGTGTLRDTTPAQWHAVTIRQMRRAAQTTMSRYRPGRPIIEDRIVPEAAAEDDATTDDPSLFVRPHDDALELLSAGPRAGAALADLTRRWLSGNPRLSVAMNRRIADLLEFGQWLNGEGHDRGSAGPVLRGVDLPLRHLLHRFVIARGNGSGSQVPPATDSSRSDVAIRRAQQRASQGMLAAITTMLTDLGPLADGRDES